MSFTITPTRKAIAVAGVAFATALAGCGSSSTSAGTASGNAASGGAPQGTTPGGGRRGFAMDTAALAKTLGVSETKLKAAIAAAQPAGFGGGPPNGTTPGGQGGPPGGTTPQGGQGGPPNGTTPGGGQGNGQFAARRTAMYAAIAKSLGLSTAKLQKAFEAQMPAGGPGGPGGPGSGAPQGAAPVAATS